MWTRADRYHVHGISGAAFTLLGGYVLAAWAKRDLGALGVIDDHGASANAVRDALELNGGAPEFWALASLSLALAGVCALSGTPLGTKRGWRKVELSVRSTLFQLVLTWQALRLGPGGESLAGLDEFGGRASRRLFGSASSAYIIAFTDDDKRSAMLVLLGTWLFGAGVPGGERHRGGRGGGHRYAAGPARHRLDTSLPRLVWLPNWSTPGASMRARG